MYFIPGLLARSTANASFIFSPPWFWLTAGIFLCSVELLIPKTQRNKYKLIALTMGISAVLVSIILWLFALGMAFDWQYIMYDEDFNLQIVFWMGLSTASIIWLRPAFIKRQIFTIPQASEAKALTEILPGETGRVLYEGSFWQARCLEQSGAIAPNQTVYVLGFEGNTLIVSCGTPTRNF